MDQSKEDEDEDEDSYYSYYSYEYTDDDDGNDDDGGKEEVSHQQSAGMTIAHAENELDESRQSMEVDEIVDPEVLRELKEKEKREKEIERERELEERRKEMDEEGKTTIARVKAYTCAALSHVPNRTLKCVIIANQIRDNLGRV